MIKQDDGDSTNKTINLITKDKKKSACEYLKEKWYFNLVAEEETPAEGNWISAKLATKGATKSTRGLENESNGYLETFYCCQRYRCCHRLFKLICWNPSENWQFQRKCTGRTCLLSQSQRPKLNSQTTCLSIDSRTTILHTQRTLCLLSHWGFIRCFSFVLYGIKSAYLKCGSSHMISTVFFLLLLFLYLYI